MCLFAQNSVRGSRQWSTLWFALWNLLDEWLMPSGKCPRFTITKTMALDTEPRSLGFHTDRSSGCCFLLNPKCWLPIHATSPEHRDTHKGNSQLTRWLVEKNNSFFRRSLSPIFPLLKTEKCFPFSRHLDLTTTTCKTVAMFTYTQLYNYWPYSDYDSNSITTPNNDASWYSFRATHQLPPA